MRNRIYISVINDLVSDQRVHRIAYTLVASGYEVEIIGRRFAHSSECRLPDIGTRRFRLFFNKGFLFYASYNIRLFFYLLTRKDDYAGAWVLRFYEKVHFLGIVLKKQDLRID